MSSHTPHEHGDHFDLLPFIAILMCVLGCLLLVTMSMAAISLGVGAGEGWSPVKVARKGPPRAAGKTGVEIAAAGAGADKTPVLIEWDGAAAVFHLESGKVSVAWTRPSGLLLGGTWLQLDEKKEADPEFHRLLGELAGRRETHYALFAVRPSGFKNFHLFSDEFRGRKIDVGYEPIDQARAVRLLEGCRDAP